MKRSALKPKRKVKPKASFDTMMAVMDRDGVWCSNCSDADLPVQLHHLLPRQRWPELIDVPENMIALDALCHANHTSARRRIPRAAVKASEPLALNDQMKAYLDSRYGPLEAERDG